MFSEKAIFYYEEGKWDSLGLLGERIHSSTIRTKYLQLCFADIGIHITRVLDNEVQMFMKYKDEKKRFLAALEYLNKKIPESKLKILLIKAIKLSDERTIYEQSRRSHNSNSRKGFWNK